MTEGQFDGMLINVVQANQGIEGFFNEIFGFLRRKTDFYTDPSTLIISSQRRRYH